MGWSSIASAGISAAGGLAGSLLSKKPKVYSPGDALRSTVNAARKLGIHPLAALGSSSGYSSPVQIGGGSMVGQMADNIGQGIREFTEAKERQREAKTAESLARKQEALIDAEIAESRSRTLTNMANYKKTLEGPRVGTLGVTGGLEKVTQPSTLYPGRPKENEPEKNVPATIEVVGPNGHVYYMPNEEAFGVDIWEMMGNLPIMAAQDLWRDVPRFEDTAAKLRAKYGPGGSHEYVVNRRAGKSGGW